MQEKTTKEVNKPFVRVGAFTGRNAIYPHDAVSKIAEDLAKDILKSKGINTKQHIPSERGGGFGEELIDKIVEFFVTNGWMISLIKILPLLKNIGQTILNWYRSIQTFYYTRKNKKMNIKPEFNIILDAALDDSYDTAPKFALDDVRLALIELWGLAPKIEKELKDVYEDFDVTFSFVARRGDTIAAGISYYAGEDNVMLKIFRKINTLDAQHSNYQFALQRTFLLRRPTYKLYKDFPFF